MQTKLKGEHPLLTAAFKGDLEGAAKFIAKNELKDCVTLTDETRKTPLHLAAKEGHVALAQFFIDKGWPIEAKDKLGTTALHLACSAGQSAVVTALLEGGADARARDSLGRTPLLYSCSSLSSECILALQDSDGGLSDMRDYSGRGPLHYAVFNPSTRQVDILRTLLECGVPVDSIDSQKKTALHHAAESGKARAIRVLLKWGASPSVREAISNKTAVELACNGNIRQLILSYCAEPSQKTLSVKPCAVPPPPPEEKRPAAVKNSNSRQGVYSDLLRSVLRKVQESGVKNNQHILNPSLYSGSWVEGVISPGALHNELSALSPSEAALKVFNVLCPYPHALPGPAGDEDELLSFFGVSPKKPTKLNSAPEDPSIIYIENEGKQEYLKQLIQGKDQEIERLQQSLFEVNQSYQRSLALLPTNEQLQRVEAERAECDRKRSAAQEELRNAAKVVEDQARSIAVLTGELGKRPDLGEVERLKLAAQQLAAEQKLAVEAKLRVEDQLRSTAGDLERAKSSLEHLAAKEGLLLCLQENPPSLQQRLTSINKSQISENEFLGLLKELGVPAPGVLKGLAGYTPQHTVLTIETVLSNLLWLSNKAQDEAELLEKLSKELRSENAQGLTELVLTLHPLERALFESNRALFQTRLREQVPTTPAATPQPHTPAPKPPLPKQNSPALPPPPKLPRPPKTPVNGSLVLSLVQGQELPHENIYCCAALSGAEKELRTNPLLGPTADWRFKGRWRLYDTDTTQLAHEIQFQLLSPGGVLGTSSLSWTAALDFPNTWTIKSTLQCLRPDGGKAGTVQAHVMWTPKTQLPVEGAGDLAIRLCELSGFGDSVVQFAVGTVHATGKAVKETLLGLNNIKLLPGRPIPGLKCTFFSVETRQIAIWRSLSMETALAATEWTRPLHVPLHPPFVLAIALKWTRHSEGENAQERAVMKIQATWRGTATRPLAAVTRKPRVVGKKAVKFENRWYLVIVSEDPEGRLYTVNVHLAGDPVIPMYEAISSASVEKQPLEEIYRNLSISPPMPHKKVIGKRVVKHEEKYYFIIVVEDNGEFLLQIHDASDPVMPMYDPVFTEKLAKRPFEEILQSLDFSRILSTEPIAGTLLIHIHSAENLFQVFPKFSLGTAFGLSSAGPPWDKKISLRGLSAQKRYPLKLALFSIETRTELGTAQLDWSPAAATPNTWTEPYSVKILKGRLTMAILWEPPKENAVEVAEDSPEPLERHSTRGLFKRLGIARNNRYYLVSVYKEGEKLQVDLHLADDPAQPMYEVKDSQTLPGDLDLLRTLEISPDHKLVFNS